MRNNIELLQSGLKCDNPSCDWQDRTIPHTEYVNYINSPCPKCAENILTEDDYKMAMYFHSLVDVINDMSDEEIDAFYNEIENPIFPADKKLKVTVDLHNGVTFNIEEDADEEK